MAMEFSEVFPTLRLTGETETYFNDVTVERVSANSQKNFIRIYIFSRHMIQKEYIRKAESEIEQQLFDGGDVVVRIFERFSLSSQYTPETIMRLYRPSIESEFGSISPIMLRLLSRAEFEFTDADRMLIRMEKCVAAEERGEDITGLFESMFINRFGLNVSVDYDLFESGRYKKQLAKNEELILQETRAIIARSEEETAKAEKENKDDAGTKGREKGGHGSSGWNKDKGSVQSKNGASDRPQQWENRYSKNGDRSYGYGPRVRKKSDNPDVIYGSDFEGEPVKITDIVGEIGELVVCGKIVAVNMTELKNKTKTIFKFDVTDFSDTITAKIFISNDELKSISEALAPGASVRVMGTPMNDKFEHNEITLQSVRGIMKCADIVSDAKKRRMDNSRRKRVELHCHTKMSDMDGVSEVTDLVKRAYSWGMPAIAITDHGVVQAFPDANKVWTDCWAKECVKRQEAGDKNPDKQDFFKVIYGVEGYLVDDLVEIVTGADGQSMDQTYVVFDLETTGFSPVNDRIIEIGAVKMENDRITDRFSTFVNPETPIPYRIEKLTGINDSMVCDSPFISEVLPKFLEFCSGCVLVAHNARFDVGFIRENCRRLGYPEEFVYIDTMGISRAILPDQSKHTLDALVKVMGVHLSDHHRAVNDAEATAGLFQKFLRILIDEKGIKDFDGLNELGNASPAAIRHMKTYHAIILAKNNTGRVNLYHLISESHLTYFARRPRISKRLFMKYREGLILGSACEAGELYQALEEGQPDGEIERIVSFYDYLEIQPCGNNMFLIESDKVPQVKSVEDIRDINRKIVKLGEQYHKPVVATCDVHFMDPEDEIYRRIIMSGQKFADADNQPPLYLRTTEEMLQEFDYLGSEKAQEVVVDNTNLIADMIDCMSPVRPDKCPPVIENSDETLRKICYERAHEIYGDKLPKIVEDRLETELHDIIGNGYAVMYIIAQKLVWKSVEDGYLVGSRGSVGSSFVANMAGITEVNSLSPHYVCPECHYYDFDSEAVKKYAGMAGCDMPDMNCPKCGAKMEKLGFDIPFQTFLGFSGDKEPDIDLNFSGEYQSKAHKYTEVIFGYGQTFRAGTIAGLADKTAYGYVKKYYEEHGQAKRSCEINRLSIGCTGVRKSTGQHPGGIVVLPVGEDINSFTPVQHPANDMTTDTVTTHFDYHKIDHNLLKLDILGHDDPTMIRMLQDMITNELGVKDFDPVKIPLDDKNVMSLFSGTEALGITPEQISGCKLGTQGIPEFGTDFVIQMLIDTQPRSFTDLIRISGLSHGTGVWLDNAQTLIKDGKTKLSGAICCRDDIMNYLIQAGMDPALSFKTMESVRKGKGLKPEMETAMKEANVPDWYIWSCKQIKYMFPKAHAAAYVMMAWRIAYCKVYYPLAYYGAFFSIRADFFSYAVMCQGREHLEGMMAECKRRLDENGKKADKKDADMYKTMRLVQEMYARGYEFMKIDIFRAKSRLFQIIDGKLMPSLLSIEGLGEKAADAVVEAAKDGPFLSKDNFIERTKVSKTAADLFGELGLLGDIPESNQISIFDIMK